METQNRTSKLPLERVILLVLLILLINALVVIYRLAFANIQINKRLQTLKEENETQWKNFSEKFQCSVVETSSPSCPVSTCPHSPKTAPEEPCLKCDAGWELLGGHCYYFNTNKSSWTESRRSCRDLGGDLVKIDSREEQMFLERKLRDLKDEGGLWIGMTDSGEEGPMLWVDGLPLNTSWSPFVDCEGGSGELPDDEDYGGNWETDGASDFCWFDESCGVLHRSVCEKTAKNGKSVCV